MFADLKNKNCCVIGGGAVAQRKVGVLLKCLARVTVYSPRLTSGLEKLRRRKNISYRRSVPKKNFLRDVFLVVAATNNRQINSQISCECRKKGILVNVVDVPGESNFIVPSFIEKNGLIIAISTSGQAPSLAKKIRQDLTRNFLPGYARLLKELSGVRNKLKDSSLSFSKRKSVLKKIINSRI